MSSVAATGSASAHLSHAVSMKVAEKTLDAARAQGDAAISLLEAAANVQKQAMNQALGKGVNLDTTA